MSMIFGGNTGVTYADIQKRRKIAEQLIKQNSGTPRNTGEGIHAIGRALMARANSRKADKVQASLVEQLGMDNPIVQKLLGIPGYKRGTDFHPGGPAIVGEDGPELLNLPLGAQVIPNPNQQNNLIDEQSVRTADLAGITPKDMGVSQNNSIQNGAFAYASLMKGLDDYEATFKDGGGTVLPGARKDALDTTRRNLQMQMKELYNLGVLNGPDLEIMDQILISPTSISGNVMDALGLADMDERVSSNISQVRKMMTDLIEPKLKAANIDIEELKPKKELSDEEFLKSLGL